MPADLPRFYLDLADFLRMESLFVYSISVFQPIPNRGGPLPNLSVTLRTMVK